MNWNELEEKPHSFALPYHFHIVSTRLSAAAAHPHRVASIVPVVFTWCSPSLLEDACFQKDHRTNQRPIPEHQWPVSYFRWRLKGKSIPGRSWGLSSTRHPKASVFPLYGSWTVTPTPNIGPTTSASAPRSPCLLRAVVGKALKALPAALVSSRSCVSVARVLGLATFEKTWQ